MMDEPTLLELGDAVVQAFRELLDIEASNKWLEEQDATSESERFDIWAQNLGLFQGGHASLDYRVRDAEFVKERLAELLKELAEHINELCSILSGERQPAEEVEWSSEEDSSESSGSSSDASGAPRSIPPRGTSPGGQSFHEVDFRFQSLSERVNGLYSLAARIRNPKNRPTRTVDQLYKHIPEKDRSAHIRDREELETSIVSYILRQNIMQAFDRDEIEAAHDLSFESVLSQYTSPDCWIVRRIGKANARRKQQLAYWKDHALRLGRTKHDVKGKAILATAPEPTAAPAQPMSHPVSTGIQAEAPSMATSATKLPALKPDDLKSVISHNSIASTMIITQDDELNWPPPPERPARGRHFECPYCKTLCPVAYLQKGQWEKHLIHDLQAYACTYEKCQDPNRLYGSKQDWLNHESQHSRVWICQEHDAEFETRPEYVSHLETEHSDFYDDDLTDALIETAVGVSKQVHRGCPFCPTGFEDTTTMQQHIAHHLIRLASMALNATQDSSEEDNGSMRSSASRQPHQYGRTASIMADFGFNHELQKLPCTALRIGDLILESGEEGPITAFYSYKRDSMVICFDNNVPGDPLRGKVAKRYQHPHPSSFLIEYYIGNLSNISLSADSQQVDLTLRTPPRFLIKWESHTSDFEDFTREEEASTCLFHSWIFSHTPCESVERLVHWLQHVSASRHPEGRNSNITDDPRGDWSTVLEKLPVGSDSRIYDWIPVSYLGCDKEWELPQDDAPVEFDNLLEANLVDSRQSFSWCDDVEWCRARRIARLAVDYPVCAICSSPASRNCKCEVFALQAAVQQAEVKMMSMPYSELREWTREHAQDYARKLFENQVPARADTESPPAKAAVNEAWRNSCVQLPKALDYFYSLVGFSVPNEKDNSILHPPLPSNMPRYSGNEREIFEPSIRIRISEDRNPFIPGNFSKSEMDRIRARTLEGRSVDNSTLVGWPPSTYREEQKTRRNELPSAGLNKTSSGSRESGLSSEISDDTNDLIFAHDNKTGRMVYVKNVRPPELLTSGSSDNETDSWATEAAGDDERIKRSSSADRGNRKGTPHHRELAGGETLESSDSESDGWEGDFSASKASSDTGNPKQGRSSQTPRRVHRIGRHRIGRRVQMRKQGRPIQTPRRVHRSGHSTAK